MNKKNLKLAIEHMKTVSKHNFDMSSWRQGQEPTPECSTVGCIVGHCTILSDTPLPRLLNGSINFPTWSYKFFDLNDSDLDDKIWNFLFSSSWSESQPSLKQAIRRMKYIYKHSTPPENWDYSLKLPKQTGWKKL